MGKLCIAVVSCYAMLCCYAPTFVQGNTGAWEGYALHCYAAELSYSRALVHEKVMHCSAMLQTVLFTLHSVACNCESFHK